MMSDLDKEKLEATRNMKIADEMFDELGYTIQNDDGKVIRFQKEWTSMWNKKEINFDRVCRFINFFDVESITMQELQAINKKCFELGWLDE